MVPTCILCWDEDTPVTLDLDGSGTFRCFKCEESFDVEDVEKALENMSAGDQALAWKRILAWVRQYPGDETVSD